MLGRPHGEAVVMLAGDGDVAHSDALAVRRPASGALKASRICVANQFEPGDKRRFVDPNPPVTYVRFRAANLDRRPWHYSKELKLAAAAMVSGGQRPYSSQQVRAGTCKA
jgi:hypothetical protein